MTPKRSETLIQLKKPPKEVEEVIQGLPPKDDIKGFMGRVKKYVDASPEERRKMLEDLKHG